MNSSEKNVQQLMYASQDKVRSSYGDVKNARIAYKNYVGFISEFATSGDLLDVGCGDGWSSFLFAELGYRTIGIDLNPSAFEPPKHPNLSLLEGSGSRIPFDDNSFDVVTACQVLEHVPSPEDMLNEMLRVTRPNGLVFIVGPNLLGINNYIQALTKHVWKNRPLYKILFRTNDMPRHPAGNTLPEVLFRIPVVTWMIFRKHFTKKYFFTMREPDLQPPWFADNDSTYLCNPLDLTKFFLSKQCEVLQDHALGRKRWTRMFAGGTWVAIRKNAT